jgi:hypothetical protein
VEPDLEYGIYHQLATNSNDSCANADPVIKTRDRRLGQEDIHRNDVCDCEYRTSPCSQVDPELEDYDHS